MRGSLILKACPAHCSTGLPDHESAASRGRPAHAEPQSPTRPALRGALAVGVTRLPLGVTGPRPSTEEPSHLGGMVAGREMGTPTPPETRFGAVARGGSTAGHVQSKGSLS